MDKLTVSLHPVHRSYAAPIIGMFLNWARNPRIWCGTRPNTLPDVLGSARSLPVCSGGGGACTLWHRQFIFVVDKEYMHVPIGML